MGVSGFAGKLLGAKLLALSCPGGCQGSGVRRSWSSRISILVLGCRTKDVADVASGYWLGFKVEVLTISCRFPCGAFGVLPSMLFIFTSQAAEFPSTA